MRLIAACIVTILAVSLSDHLIAAPPSAAHRQIGRYQMVVGFNGTIYVLDTKTGHCWSRVSRGRWTDEGNPTLTKEETADSPPTLVLPQEKVQLTIKQRRSKPIPGSDDRILLRIDDITGGQVLISVRDDRGEVLLDDVSVDEGDVVSFKVSEESYFVRVAQLKNFLTGEDIAVLEIASNAEVLRPAEEAENSEEGNPDAKEKK